MNCGRSSHFDVRYGERGAKNELTLPMLNELIEKVVVHEADKSHGTRVQKVDIFLNTIDSSS
jgi:hypothetical protein